MFVKKNFLRNVFLRAILLHMQMKNLFLVIYAANNFLGKVI
ncbi:unnamed protein product [Larinioides sclopetarius]